MARPKIESKTFKLAGKEFTVKIDGEGAAFFCGDKWICDIEQRKKIDDDSLKGLIRMTEPLLKMSMGIQQRESKKDTIIKFNGDKPKRHRRTKAEIEQDKLKPKKRVRRTKAQIEADKLKAQSKSARKPRSDKGKPRVRKAV